MSESGTIDEPIEDRILDAAVRCVARWGVGKTTLDDIAREAGCSRATLYRVLPGGRDALLVAATDRELQRFLRGLATRLDDTATLEDVIVSIIHEAVAAVSTHDALQYLLSHEPEQIAPFVAFDALDPLLAEVTAFVHPWLARHLDDVAADEVGEWIARLVLSYGLEPADDLDLTRRDAVVELVRFAVLPGIALAETSCAA